jgi:hypothetical protein
MLPKLAAIGFHGDMSESKPEHRGWSVLQICVTVLGIMVLIGITIPMPTQHQHKAMQAATTGNARQIVTALSIYAQDHNGRYPDADLPSASSSNEVFRRLIEEEILQDELIFGAKASKFFPDNNIGAHPDYAQALEAGENHWAMTVGVTKGSDKLTPVVFENPAVASWPPLWNADAALKPEKGALGPRLKSSSVFTTVPLRQSNWTRRQGPPSDLSEQRMARTFSPARAPQ